MMSHRVVAAVLILALPVAAQTGIPPQREANLKRVEAAFVTAQAEFADDAAVLIRRGLVADRAQKQVKLLAEATGLGEDETVEFLLIGETSGHDYESLAVSFAKPSDVHDALVHIGLSPGRTIDAEALQFWPKGERVVVAFRRLDDGEISPIRAEDLILNNETKVPLREAGFIFAGSARRAVGEGDGAEQVYLADVAEPNSIASNYNEPQTVLDVPRRAPQGSVYGKQVVNPAFTFERGELLEVHMWPEYTDGKRRVVDLDLRAEVGEGGAGQALGGLVFHVAPNTLPDVGVVPGAMGLGALAKLFADLREAGHDPYVTLHVGDSVPLGALHQLCQLLASIETETGIRIEAPPAGQLYYEAFLPDESYRDREKRPAQPWELHLWSGPEQATGVVWQIEQHWGDDSVYPDLTTTRYPVSQPKQFAATLANHGPGIPVVLVYVRPDITNGQLMSYVEPVRGDYPIVFVLMED